MQVYVNMKIQRIIWKPYGVRSYTKDYNWQTIEKKHEKVDQVLNDIAEGAGEFAEDVKLPLKFRLGLHNLRPAGHMRQLPQWQRMLQKSDFG